MSERRIVQYSDHGTMIIEQQLNHPLIPATVNGVLVPEYPKLQMRAMPVNDNDGSIPMQHFMLESLVRTKDCYVLCSQRYQMSIIDSGDIMKHIEAFHGQFIEKCEEIKKNFKF